jgi:hypothetical protein
VGQDEGPSACESAVLCVREMQDAHSRIGGEQLGTLYEKSSSERGGAVATYIPQLATVPPEQYGTRPPHGPVWRPPRISY